jgi:hypothetical protein
MSRTESVVGRCTDMVRPSSRDRGGAGVGATSHDRSWGAPTLSVSLGRVWTHPCFPVLKSIPLMPILYPPQNYPHPIAQNHWIFRVIWVRMSNEICGARNSPNNGGPPSLIRCGPGVAPLASAQAALVPCRCHTPLRAAAASLASCGAHRRYPHKA